MHRFSIITIDPGSHQQRQRVALAQKKENMERHEFLKILGTSSLAVCAGCTLYQCAEETVDPNVDFTLDLTLPENSALLNAGGSLSRQGVIVVRFQSNEFVALRRACTHEGTDVNFQSSKQNFRCPTHGSEFSKTGAVQIGPATRPLKKYNTELTNDTLRVFS
jgi:cytochrome b6-f complex iron-sulfur subunit